MENKLVKKKSSIHGKGIFTKTTIKKNTLFYKVPTTQVFNHPKRGCAFIGNNLWLSDKKVLNYLNHSCNPNTILSLSKTKPPSLISRKNIKAGEELTVNYTKTEKGGNKAKCICKSKDCKGYFLRIE